MAEGIRNFYKDKTIFITGGSGFMGKVLLEKFLYSCPDLKEIMILMRPKRGKTGAERVREFAQIPVSCSRRLAANLLVEFSFLFYCAPRSSIAYAKRSRRCSTKLFPCLET